MRPFAGLCRATAGTAWHCSHAMPSSSSTVKWLVAGGEAVCSAGPAGCAGGFSAGCSSSGAGLSASAAVCSGSAARVSSLPLFGLTAGGSRGLGSGFATGGLGGRGSGCDAGAAASGFAGGGVVMPLSCGGFAGVGPSAGGGLREGGPAFSSTVPAAPQRQPFPSGAGTHSHCSGAARLTPYKRLQQTSEARRRRLRGLCIKIHCSGSFHAGAGKIA